MCTVSWGSNLGLGWIRIQFESWQVGYPCHLPLWHHGACKVHASPVPTCHTHVDSCSKGKECYKSQGMPPSTGASAQPLIHLYGLCNTKGLI